MGLESQRGLSLRFLLVSSAILLLPASFASTTNRVLTLFTYQMVPWNDAAELCKSRGGQLFTMESEDARLAVKYFSDTSWRSQWKDDFWIGLHKPSYKKTMWHGSCFRLGDYQPFAPQTLIQRFGRCAAGKEELVKGDYWEWKSCHKTAAKAICEREQGDCSFVERSDRKVRSVTPQTYRSVVSLEDCEAICLQETGQPECWALDHSEASQDCRIYRAESKGQLIDQVREEPSSTPLYIKICFTAEVNNMKVDIISTDWRDDYRPWAGCKEYRELGDRSSTGSSETTVTTSVASLEARSTKQDTVTTPVASLEARSTKQDTSSEDTFGLVGIAVSTSDTISVKNLTTEPREIQKATTTEESGVKQAVTTTIYKATVSTASETATPNSSEAINVTKNKTPIRETANLPTTTPVMEMSSASVAETPTTAESETKTTEVIKIKCDPTTLSDIITTSVTSLSHLSRVTSAVSVDSRGGNSVGRITSSSESTTESPNHNLKQQTALPYRKMETTRPGAVPGRCPCRCWQPPKLSAVEKKEFIDGLISSISVNKSDLSADRMRYKSAHDPRPSAQNMGVLGIVLMVMFIGGFLVMDIYRLFYYLLFLCKYPRR